MGKCTNCEATLDPGWKFCIACGEAVAPTEEDAAPAGSGRQAESGAEAELGAEAESDAQAEPVAEVEAGARAESIPSAIRPDPLADDEPLPRKRLDVALLLGIVMAVGGGVLIIVVAIVLFSPRG